MIDETEKYLYGLNDASLKWFRAAKEEVERHGCKQCSQDPAFFYRHEEEGNLDGIICL